MNDTLRRWKPATRALFMGKAHRGIGEPVTPGPEMAASFLTHPDAVGFSAADLTAATPHFYTRWSNPTIELLETRLAALENGEAAVAFASGMAATHALFTHRLAVGDHLVLSNICYAGVAELAQDGLARAGIAVTPVDTSDLDAVAAALRPDTRLVHIETPANPTLRLADVAAIARLAHAAGAELSVDATIATPLGIQSLALGADYVVHSLTKYICGHGDALGGAVIGSAERMAGLRRNSLIHLGGCLSPFAAWLILRGLETLVPRMALHETNARQVEAFLAAHPRVRAVQWPGSPRHPQHALALRQMLAYSGLLAFSVKADGLAVARRLAERLQVVSYAVSLGKTKSLLVYIPTDDILRTSFRMTGAAAAAYRDWTGDGTFRLSVGLEDADDIIADLEQGLA